jgi:acyl carrier protein
LNPIDAPSQIDAQLQEIAREAFRNDSLILTDSMGPYEVAGWDSLGHVNLMLSIEIEFDLEFSDEEMVRFSNVGELKRIIAEKLQPV